MRLFTQQWRALLLSAVLVVGSVCVSNGDNPSNLVGQWVSTYDGSNIELFNDGTGVIGNTSLTWKTMGKRFVWSYDNETYVSDYNLSAYELTRTFDDGYVVVWVRKDKVEEYKKKNTINFTDSRNGQKYRAVKIGAKTWMAQNLNYQTGKSWCYGGDNSNCEKYGRLYDWNTAKTACPSGWHLPSREEWNGLESASGDDVAGKMLKSTNGWYGNGNGIDANGFSALPGGYRDVDGSFSNVGKYGVWWTTSVDESGHADDRAMDYGVDYVSVFGFGEGRGLSVRCLQN